LKCKAEIILTKSFGLNAVLFTSAHDKTVRKEAAHISASAAGTEKNICAKPPWEPQTHYINPSARHDGFLQMLLANVLLEG
jgi:hypothetical protein